MLDVFNNLKFHQLNYRRAIESFFTKEKPMTTERLLLKATEELGEVTACINKMNRGFSPHIVRENYETDQEYNTAQADYVAKQKENFASELGQLYIVLSQLATLNNLNLEIEAVKEFNKVSKKIKSEYYY